MIMKWLRRRGPIRHVWILVALLVLTPKTEAQNVEASRIVAVGDIHGDFDAFVDILNTRHSRRHAAGARETSSCRRGYTDRGRKAGRVDYVWTRGAGESGGWSVAVLLGNHE